MDKLSRPHQDYSVDGNSNTSISLNKGKSTYATFKVNGPHVFCCAIFSESCVFIEYDYYLNRKCLTLIYIRKQG